MPPAEASAAKFDEYVSDPAKPVPYRPRPIDDADEMGWRTWLVTDQRFVDGRPDVLTYETEPLKEPMKLSGEPVVHLVASTTGTDSDWIVKLIDVQPDRTAPPTHMSGYQLPIATDIFRGRYRTSFEHPEADQAQRTADLRLRATDGQPHLPTRSQDYGPGAVHALSSLRSQPTTVRRKHLRSQTRRFPESNTANLAPAWPRKLHQPAGCSGIAALVVGETARMSARLSLRLRSSG